MILDNISFFTDNKSAGVAELSKLDEHLINLLSNTIKINKYFTWFYFNRLIVKQKYRKTGVGTELMDSVIKWADRNKIAIWDDLNPYGDKNSLTLKQLTKFMSKFGFIKKAKQVMVRYPK